MPASFMEDYKAKHRHPLNRLTHSIGIPMIVVSLPLFFFSWRAALALFVVGWALQFVGHWIEGNQPAFFRNPIYLLIGPLWIARRALSAVGLAKPVTPNSPAKRTH
ncbi:MAG: DUF962 domain-containing protein [Acidobacteria bacterium]|nr:DUF962 domain-containing protein [Acidobacteriota bacterium]